MLEFGLAKLNIRHVRLRISQHSIKMRENVDQNDSEYGHTFYAVQLDKSQKEYMLSMVLGFPGEISHHSILVLEIEGFSQGLLPP